MTVFLHILTNIMLPIFILIALGFIIQKKLRLDIRTFTKLNIYLLIPSIIFTKIYETDVTWQLFGTILLYLFSIFTVMLILGTLISRTLQYPRGIRNAFMNSLMFFNAGNYGLPVAELAFSYNPLATTAQIFIMLVQNLLGSTFGVFQATAGRSSNKQALRNVLTIPSIYVVMLVIILKGFHINVPEFILIPFQNLTKGFIPIALITLGVQLAEVQLNTRIKDVLLSSFIRLILAPIIGFGLVKLMGIEGLLAKSLILGVATPTAVNSAIIAKEFNNEPEYASQIVFISTVFSVGTISLLILIMEHIQL